MMKCEFEEMIGKEVTAETFEMYETMYLALPETVNKQQFVAMLDIKAIPESPEAIARRAENERVKAEIKNNIAELKAEIKDKQNEIENMKSWVSFGDENGYWKREIKWTKSIIANKKAQIREWQFVLGE